MKKIILIEDDTDTIDMMQHLLKNQGYVVIYANRDICVEEIASIKPELLIIDYWLRNTLGTEVCKKIKDSELTKHIPVIIYSANKNIESLAIAAGADAYISKPFDVDIFSELIAEKIL